MSKWSRLKVALLTATVTLSALPFTGCLGANWWARAQQYHFIADLF